jgi:hypothetical protein
VGAQWDLHRDAADDRFAAAVSEAAALLEKAVVDLKAQVSMYHGCGAICHSIAYQFGEEVLRVSDTIKTIEPESIADWTDVLRASGTPTDHSATPMEATLLPAGPNVPALVALLCATVVLCFGIACFTLLKLRGAPAGRA